MRNVSHRLGEYHDVATKRALLTRSNRVRISRGVALSARWPSEEEGVRN
jgi:hypothetical protein